MKGFFLYSKLVYNGRTVAYRYINRDNYYIDFSVQDVVDGKVPRSFKTVKSVKTENAVIYKTMYCTPIEAQYYKEGRIFETRDSDTGLKVCHIDSLSDKKIRLLALNQVKIFMLEHKDHIGSYAVKGYSRVNYESAGHVVEFTILGSKSYSDIASKVEGYFETYFLRWLKMMKVHILDISVSYIGDEVYDVNLYF